jgi:hypothetical protein
MALALKAEGEGEEGVANAEYQQRRLSGGGEGGENGAH